MNIQDADTNELLHRADDGDSAAVQQLLSRHRNRLRRMVAVHLDPRLATRVDPSDVVQETMVEASQEFGSYLRERPVAFYPWLRAIAWQRLVKLRQFHITLQKRSVLREQQWDLQLSDDSVMELAGRFISGASSPSRQLIRKEMRERVRATLAKLPSHERQVVVLRYLEQLSTHEAVQVLGITEAAFHKRHVRAIQHLREMLT